MRAVEECPTPVVSIPGGEPLMHPEIDRIVEGLVERKRYVYLCTNALLLEEKLDLFTPSRFLSFSVHLDGLEPEHDASVCRTGSYRKARRAIERALERGFRVTTNTTLFETADPERTARFFDELMDLGVEGMMISPGYAYQKAPDHEHFLDRERTLQLFRRIFARRGRRRWRFNQSPLFLEYLLGARNYDCTAWAMPSYGVFGWQKPCYLLQEGYSESLRGLLEETRWERYGHASANPKCRDCMVHSGFEGSAVQDGFSSLGGLLAMARAFLFGPRAPAPEWQPRRAAPAVPQGAPAPSQGWAADAGAEALRVAFDYRGDVTLSLDDDSSVEGYVANVSGDEVELWLRGSSERQRIPAQRIVRVALTGRDTAAGRSYQTWLARSA
jgi:hopanoid biosynthesis associated radical SAM protein HpnH